MILSKCMYLCSSQGLIDGLHYHTWRHLIIIGLTNRTAIMQQEKYKDMWIVLVNTDHFICFYYHMLPVPQSQQSCQQTASGPQILNKNF